MNEDLISRKALIKEFAVRARVARNWKESAINNGNDESAIRADAILSFITEVKLTIENAPTVENERPTGKWISDGFCFSTQKFKCSICHLPELEKTNYCPNCGADMRGNTKRKGTPIEGNNESYNCENWIP